MASTSRTVPRLYRRALQLSLDWSVRRDVWRPQALAIRKLFDDNKNVRDPRQLKVIIADAQHQLDKWKHPDPYISPTAPGGSKYERNLPCHVLDPPPRMDL